MSAERAPVLDPVLSSLLARVSSCRLPDESGHRPVYAAFDLVKVVKDCNLPSAKKIIWRIFKDYGDFLELSTLPEGAFVCKFPANDEETVGLTLEAAIEVLLLLPESQTSRDLRRSWIRQRLYPGLRAEADNEDQHLAPRPREGKKTSGRGRLSSRLQLVFATCCAFGSALVALSLDSSATKAPLAALCLSQNCPQRRLQASPFAWASKHERSF